MECLWDREATVRIEGTRIARLDTPSVRERIDELALDLHEDKDVIDPARRRIDNATGQGSPGSVTNL